MEMPARGESVIPAHARRSDQGDDRMGAKLRLFNAQPICTRKKRRLRKELDARRKAFQLFITLGFLQLRRKTENDALLQKRVRAL